MEIVEQIVQAALAQEALLLRSLVQQFLRSNPRFEELPVFNMEDPIKFALAAAIIELLAEQTKQIPPSWTVDAGSLPEPMFLLKSAAKMKRLRQLCVEESPLPLKKRGFYAPPNYLSFA
ncbi:MAG: hypothetical protein GY943_34690 [Chloroflexi bacterium]|nr:hypothetical protein [Chloroflexota bacterium]